jgi:hypothetical protein
MSDEELIERLDTIIAILRLGHKDSIDRARAATLADPIAAAVLQAATEWTDSGTLQGRAAATSGQSRRTVQRRIAGLLAEGFLEQTGSGPSVRYRSTNLI